jgi:error-prone DNA polymerase
VDWNQVEEHAEGLTALFHGDDSLTPATLDRAKSVFGRERLWVDVSRHLERSAEAASRRAISLAETAHVSVVASGDVRCAQPADRRLLDAFACLREKTTLDAAGRLLLANGERTLKRREAMAARFADHPDWIRATRSVAERCAFGLGDLGYRFPEFPVPAGESQASFLRQLSYLGARERYGHPLSSRVRAQLEHELSLIEKLDLAGYFLIVHDIVCFATRAPMLVQGRGSAANSAVCYALGITAVDPVGMELLFERFLSEERGEWPDIDLDLPSGDQREKVIQYVFDKYGSSGAAMTANVITYRTRMAVREMGKVLGHSPESIDKLSKLLSSLRHNERLDELPATLREAGVDPEAPRMARLLDLVDRVQGLPRHLGQHSGGIVIAAGRLDEVVPIEPASMQGRRVVQWDKEDCADIGIIKIDLLGLGMLAALEDTIPLVREHEGVEIDLAHLPPDDPETYAMIQSADTIGTFQIESRAQMATLPRLKPKCFYDLVIEIAIIRPGPIVGQMVHPYLNRRAGREPIVYPHPSLEVILKRTLGVPLFQEQLLRIAMEASGFSGGEAEELRRAMGFKRSQEKMKRIERRLREGMQERGFSAQAQEDIIRQITSFALYGFPESHSASFALIAYASAYLKRHHPAAFLAGLLNAYPMGFYLPATLVKDAQRHGVEVRPIDVAHSCWKTTLESGAATGELPPDDATNGASHTSSGPAVRIGLRYAAGLRGQTAAQLELERNRLPFTSLEDLAARVSLKRNELDTLAELGALASLQGGRGERRAALWQVAALERDRSSFFSGRSSSAERQPDQASPLTQMTPFEETLTDYRLAGMTTGPHLMTHMRAELRNRGVLAAEQVRGTKNGVFVRTAGHVIVRQRPESAKGFIFLTLEDETGTSNAVLTPDAFQRFRVPLSTAAVVELAGPVQNVDGVVHVSVRELSAIVPRRALPRSHDYR